MRKKEKNKERELKEIEKNLKEKEEYPKDKEIDLAIENDNWASKRRMQ